MVKKKKNVRVNGRTQKIDNNNFILIVGGGFVVIAFVLLIFGSYKNKLARDTAEVTPTETIAVEEMGSENITVSSPKAQDVIKRPVTITGTARVFENVVSYRIKDSDGFVLVSGSTTYEAEDTGEFGEYTITTNYLEPKGETGVVEVYNASAKDGSDENVVRVPVKFGSY